MNRTIPCLSIRICSGIDSAPYICANRAFLVQQNPRADALRADIVAHDVARFLKIDCQEDHCVGIFFLKILDNRHGHAAGTAPRRPEIKHHDLAFILIQRDLLSVQVRELEVGCSLADFKHRL